MVSKNKKAVGPSLTWVLISLTVFITIISFSYNSYSTFVADNTLTIDTAYINYYENLSVTQNKEIYGLGNTFRDRGVLDVIYSFASTLVNTFVVGLSAIGSLFGMIPILGNIFEILNLALPGFSGLIGLASIIAIIYIAMKYLQARRGTVIEP